MDESWGLIGRRTELDRLLGVADPSATGGLVLLSGDAGIGKTALLGAAIARANAAGVQVLSITAARSERELAFAGLHALLDAQPVAVNTLPARHRGPLLAILGTDAGPASTDRLSLGVATLALLRALSEHAPLLVVVDDVHWLDESSMAALAFAGRRLAGSAVSVILSGRDDLVPDGLHGAISELRLGPLAIEDAAQLLDQQGYPAPSLAREQVLAQSAGNPAALIEFGAAAAGDEPVSRWALDPLPVSRRVARVYASQLSGLPESTLTALLVASAASPGDLAAVLGRSSVLDIDTLSAAELAGLITVTSAGVAFVHPLLRSALYYRAPFTARASAHRTLAAALKDRPDRRAWHLGKAALGPDEQIAVLLEATHQQAQERGGFIAAAVAMERAAALSPDRGDRARRLLVAAGLARFTDDFNWTGELANQALAITADPEQESRARMELGWALCWTTHHETALGIALPLVSTSSIDVNVRWEALRMAATVTYQAGGSEARQAVSDALDSLEHDTAERGLPASLTNQQHWTSTGLFTRLITDPRCIRPNLVQINQIGDAVADPLNVGAAGVAAWLGDETDLSLRLLRHAVEESRVHGAGRQSAAVLMALAWACADTGRWDEALLASAELANMAVTRGQPFVRSLSSLVTATVLAWRGDPAGARECLALALAGVDPDESRAAGAWAQHAAGLISLTEDDDLTAYLQLRRLFEDDGTPFHYHVSYLGLADLAEAAVRSGHQQEARDVIACATAQLGAGPSARLTQLLAYAQALLAERADAEEWFVKALSNRAGEQWPFERARLRLSYGEWLRRDRRITEAKRELTLALTVFDGLHAAPWIARAAREIRAAGVRVAGAATGLSDLSPQEHQVAYLAAEGLSNRQIGQLLNLSPRTVGAHLYRAFPKLGVTDRRQIRDIPPPEGSDETPPLTGAAAVGSPDPRPGSHRH